MILNDTLHFLSLAFFHLSFGYGIEFRDLLDALTQKFFDSIHQALAYTFLNLNPYPCRDNFSKIFSICLAIAKY